MITPRRGPGTPVLGSAPTRMRPTDWRPSQAYPSSYTAVETRNGLPVGRYRWQPPHPCAAGALPCRRCELARGCGRLFDRGQS